MLGVPSLGAHGYQPLPLLGIPVSLWCQGKRRCRHAYVKWTWPRPQKRRKPTSSGVAAPCDHCGVARPGSKMRPPIASGHSRQGQAKNTKGQDHEPCSCRPKGRPEPTCCIRAMIRASTPLPHDLHGGMFVLQSYLLLPFYKTPSQL